MARTNAALKNNPQFQALVATLGSEEKAKVAFERLRPTAPKVDPRVAELMAAGFTEDEAKAALTEAPAEVEAKVEVDPADALREKKGYAFAKGRVYSTSALIEAQARVLRSGKPEIVVGRLTAGEKQRAVLVSKLESGDLSLQNLIKG
jgi:hypothetical protein